MPTTSSNQSTFPVRWALIGLTVIALLYLTVNHGVHLLAYLPLAFLLGCLLMHMFMHGSHGSQSGGENRDHHSHDHR